MKAKGLLFACVLMLSLFASSAFAATDEDEEVLPQGTEDVAPSQTIKKAPAASECRNSSSSSYAGSHVWWPNMAVGKDDEALFVFIVVVVIIVIVVMIIEGVVRAGSSTTCSA